MLELDIAYKHAKFDHSSFSHSGDMVGAHQNFNGSRDLTTPLSGTVCRPRASTSTMINLSTTFEVYISAHYEDTKGNTKQLRSGVVRGHWK